MHATIESAGPYHVAVTWLTDDRRSAGGRKRRTGAKCAPRGVLSVCVPEGVGLIASTSDWLADRKADIAASYASRLIDVHGAHYRFCIDPNLELSQDDRDMAVQRIEREWPEVVATLQRAAGLGSSVAAVEPVCRYDLNLIGLDRLRLLADTAKIFACHGLSIATQASRSFDAPADGPDDPQPLRLFTIRMKVDVPQRRTAVVQKVRAELERWAAGEGLDVSFQPRAAGASPVPGSRAGFLNSDN